MTQHTVKSWPWFFKAIKDGTKTHELRDKIDRDYKVGDTILMQEFDPRGSGYTGDSVLVEITYITSNDTPCALSGAVLDRSYCILSIKALEGV